MKHLLLVGSLLILIGLGLSYVSRSRGNADRIRCQDHLKDLGLFGVRHPSTPGSTFPMAPKDELPPGTFDRPGLPPTDRMSWYAYTLNAIADGSPSGRTRSRFQSLGQSLATFNPTAPWNSESNLPLAKIRFTTPICPAQVRPDYPDSLILANYVAIGGLGVETPAIPLELASKRAGAYRYDLPTQLISITDGLNNSAQIIETNSNLGPWLQGGQGTIRGLDVTAEPYLGISRQFGGCHPGGAFAGMVDGSVRFVRETINPSVFRAMLTIAGGVEEIEVQ